MFSLCSDKEKGESKKRFHCHFQLPLPEQIIIFSLGKWEPDFKGQEIIAEVSIDAEIPPQKIGSLTSRNKVLCWDEGWTTKFLKRSEQLCEEVQSILSLVLVQSSLVNVNFRRIYIYIQVLKEGVEMKGFCAAKLCFLKLNICHYKIYELYLIIIWSKCGTLQLFFYKDFSICFKSSLHGKHFHGVREQRKTEEWDFWYFACSRPIFLCSQPHGNACYAGYFKS